MLRALSLALVLSLGSCVGAGGPALDGGADGGPFIAESADFEGFQRWERIPIESPTVPAFAHPGPAFVYVNRRPPPGATRFPNGTMVVKAIESGDDPRGWTVHAMARRGEPFNARGSVGWEFFGLQLHEDGRPIILWRNDGESGGSPYGEAPVAGAIQTCNSCHAVPWQDDSILTGALSLHP